MGECRLREHHPGDHVRVEDIDEALLVECSERTAVHVAGVVHQHVEVSVSVGDGGVDHRGPVGRHRHVADDRGAARADRCGDGVHLVGPTTRDGHASTAIGEVFRGPRAQSGAATGDQHRHSFDRSHERTPVCVGTRAAQRTD